MLHEQGFFWFLYKRVNHGHVLVVQVVVSQHFHVLIELEDERDSVWDSQVKHLVVVDTGQQFDHTPEHMLVGGI